VCGFVGGLAVSIGFLACLEPLVHTACILRGALPFLYLGSIISKCELVLIALVRIVSVNVIIIIFFSFQNMA
jgi:hypothetical protein